MTLPQSSLDLLCPLHARLDAAGRLVAAGPTLTKLLGGDAALGAPFATVFDIYRPREVQTPEALQDLAGRKLQLRLRHATQTALRGVAVPDGQGGLVLNLSFGIGVVEAVRSHALTSTDFAATDLAIDMLYLVEAKSAAMAASRTLNRRLQGAMLAAEQRAYTDPLTGLRNRRAVAHVLGGLLRQESAFALMHLDLDYFKQVNDSHGHGAGDRVLQVVARVMLDLPRRDDTVARIGGDEFVLILAGLTGRKRLAHLASRLIRRIEEPIPVGDTLARVSASIGIACHDGGGGLTAAQVLHASDLALYAAKRAGRAQYAFLPVAEGRTEAQEVLRDG